MKKVIGLGANVFDTLISCKRYPTEDTKMRAEAIYTSGGGPVGNALVVLSRLGVCAGVLGAFADDEAGKYLLADFQKHGVDTAGASVCKSTRSFCSYILLSEEGKSRTCVFDRGNVADDPALLDYSVLEGASVLHLDGNYLRCAIEGAKRAKAMGIKVSLDAGAPYPGIEQLLTLVDILIPSEEFALRFTGRATLPEALLALEERYHPEVLIATCGKEGGYAMMDGSCRKFESYAVKVKDTNGAGDTFHGAFIAAYCDGLATYDAARFAAAVAAYKCTFHGARSYPLSRAEIEKFISAYN